jgi:hypothetical protein
MQRFGSAANLNIHLHGLVLDGVYRRGIDGAPKFVEVPEPTDEALQSVLHKIITRTMKLLTGPGGAGVVSKLSAACQAVNRLSATTRLCLWPADSPPAGSEPSTQFA